MIICPIKVLVGTFIASYHIILASDASKSYVVLKYTSCLSGITLRATPGLYYLSSSGQQMSNTLTNPCTVNSYFVPQGHKASTWVMPQGHKSSHNRFAP
jgi:hypothetical protein